MEYKKAFELAMDYIKKSPCDPDIDKDQLEAWNILNNYIKDFKYNPDKYKPPFRVGKKQGKAVLDANGLMLTVFEDETQAGLYVDYLNK